MKDGGGGAIGYRDRDSARELVSGGADAPINTDTPSNTGDTSTSTVIQVLREAASWESGQNIAEPVAEPGTSDADRNTTTAIPRSVAWRLYLSHLLSTWNSRSFEFGSVLFLAAIYPNTLFYLSIYAMLRAASGILLAGAIGWFIDCKARLPVARCSIGTFSTWRGVRPIEF